MLVDGVWVDEVVDCGWVVLADSVDSGGCLVVFGGCPGGFDE